MCEYCGCQAVPAIAELTAEHDQVVDLIGRIRTAYRDGRVDDMIVSCRQIAAVLAPHTATEEQGLFPVMAVEFPDQIATLQAEHRHIEAVLSEAADGAPAPDATWPARIIEALGLLRLHILKEQDGVFPAALSTLTTEQWEHLDEIRHTGSVPPR